MFKLINLTFFALAILAKFAFLGNILFCLYIAGLKLSSHRFIPFFILIASLSIWIVISFSAYFLVGIASFSNSDKILDRLTPSLIVLVYLIIGLIFFLSIKFSLLR